MWGSQAWNQWALQPSMFNNVPHDEIDWAALAKQWIQMQKPGSGGDAVHMMSSSAAGPPPPPSMPPSMPPQVVEDYSRDGISPVPLNVDQFSGGRPELPNAPSAVVHPESVPNFGPRDASDTYWHPEWETNMSGDIDERVWAPPPPVMMPSEKKTFDYGHIHDNPPLAMQTVDYNHVSEHYYNQMYAPEDPYDQYWSQVGSAPMMPLSFLKKDRINNFQNEEDTSHIDAAKRKQLPAWIREGLEKMEQERLKRLEKERAEKEQAERSKKSASEPQKKGLLGTGEYESSSISMPSKSKFESDSEHEEEEPETKFQSLPSERVKSRPLPVEETLTEEERQHQLVLKVRRLLTEVLLDVTNSEMAAIAKEIHSKALAKAPAKPLTTTTALRSLATGLHSLASYESHSDVSESEQDENDSSTSDEELHRRIQEKRRKFASKERKIIAEIEEAELREKERKKLQSTQDNRNSESSVDHLKSKKILPSPVKSETEIETKDSNAANQSTSTVDSVNPPMPIASQTRASAPVDESENSHVNHKAEAVDDDDDNKKKENSPKVNLSTGENGDSKLSPKKRESSTSTDSESDSSSSVSSNSQMSRSDKKRKRTSTDRKSSRHSDTKSRKRSRSNSPKYKREKRKNDRRDSNDSSRKHSKSVSHSKLKKHQSRSKKRSKEKSRRRSESSKSSQSSSYSQLDYQGHSERSRRRSTSHHRHHRKSRSHSRRRSRSTSRYREDSQGQSYSKRESYGDKHKSDSNKYREDYRKSRKERYSRSRSPSVMLKRYRRKSRSLSMERRSHYKKSKIRTHDR